MTRIARLGLFGGTFDPPHHAHLALARIARDELALDALHWIPAGDPWQKKTRRITAASHRAAMVKLAIDAERGFVLDERELRRSGPSYTIDSVTELQAEHPGAGLFLIIGRDQYLGLPSWHRWQALCASVTLAVAQRPGSHTEPPEALRGIAVRTLGLPPMDVSATAIRAMAARGEDISSLVPAAVARYIAQHRLYKEPHGN